MKLYFHPLSGNSRRVLLVAEHLHVPLERVVVDLTKHEQRGEAHRARNPTGRVPVLDDDGFVLWESRAIMQYLADTTPGQTLLPTDARGRADVNRWLSWCTAHMAPANTILVQENFVKPLRGEPTVAAEVARGEALFADAVQVLDALGSPFEWDVQQAWLGRVQALDAWKATAPPPPPR